MKKLIKGLHKFQTEVFPIKKDFFENLVKGQKPEVLFITCSDSRINPNLVTSSDLGDLFVLRNAGNIIPPYGLSGSEDATIEFAISKLKIKEIVICGHSYCGALEAALQGDDLSNTPGLCSWIQKHIGPTLSLIKLNYNETDKEHFLNILVQEHVLRQIENLKSYPVVIEAINNNNLSLHAWVYNFETGQIFSFNPDLGQFNLLSF